MPTVEVWEAQLNQSDRLVRRLAALLSDDERARADRLASPARWIVARAALRVVLADRAGTHPRDVVFATGPHGKPHLPGATTRFNLSHSGDLAVIAVAERVELGIDVERTSRRSAAVERTLTPAERAALAGPDRHTELLRIWCRKEAMAKAGGGGLAWAPEAFDSTRPGELSLIDLPLGDGYVGALAVHGEPPELTRRHVELTRAAAGS